MRIRIYSPLVKSTMPFAVGAVLDIIGKVQKVVRRDGQCKLVIEPGNAPGFVVFADCFYDAEIVINRKIRKGSAVSVRGRFASYGARAVCLSDCRLMPEVKSWQKSAVKDDSRSLSEPNKT